MAPLDATPFYGFEVRAGALGTKGGLVTTSDAEVRSVRGDVIPGLFAAGNGTAHVMGRGYAGGGASIGPNVVFGYLAGRSAADFVVKGPQD